MSITIIGAEKKNRERLSWMLIRDAISSSINLPNETPCREYMSSNCRVFLSDYPDTSQKRKDLAKAIKTYLSRQDMRVIDYHILSHVVFLLENGRDASYFFTKTRSANAERIALYARTKYEFNDNDKKDEELY
jgi:hypothetical protein